MPRNHETTRCPARLRRAAAVALTAPLMLAAISPAAGAEKTPLIGAAALTAFESLPLLTDWPCYQASSYSREDVNADAGNFIRVEPDGEQVMLETDGPGCIYRFWTTGVIEPNVPVQSSDDARILIYFDGETTPRVDLSVPEMFGLRGVDPFVPPLSRSFESGRGPWEGHASICYVPIPFEKSIKVTGRNMSFYHINYHLLPEGAPVTSFTMEPTPADRRRLAEAARILDAVGEDPKPQSPNAATQAANGSLLPGETREITVEGPAVIDALRVKVDPPAHLALRGLELRIEFDDASGPSVRSTLGDFFGTGCDDRRFKSLPLGMTDDGYYCYFPMPFRRCASVRIVNPTERAFELVRFEVVAHRETQIPDNAGYFHALYRQQKDIPHRDDYNILTAEGRGRFLGCNLTMQSAERAGGIFFLEGDEKIYADGETWPSRYLGTGTEDYFNGAYFWNAVKFEHGPYSGLTYIDWGTKRVCAYRYHLTDTINFAESIVVDIEHGPVSDHPSDYAGVAYWYQLPAAALAPLPAVADRMPVTYVGEGPAAAAVVKIVSGPAVDGKELPTRPWQEADPEFVGTAPQRFLAAEDPGAVIEVELESPVNEIFTTTLYLSASPDGAKVEAALDGKTLGIVDTYRPQFAPWIPTRWDKVLVAKGPHRFTLKALERNPLSSGSTVGWVGLDFAPNSPFVREWYVMGPFDNAEHSGFEKAFPPEREIDTSATYEGLGGQEVGWKPVDVEQQVNLSSVCGGGDWRVAYGLTRIWAPRRTETTAIFGKDDGARIWVNGALVFDDNSWSHCFPDQYVAPVTLEEGWNTFLIKVANHGGAWGFMVRICDPEDQLRISRNPQQRR